MTSIVQEDTDAEPQETVWHRAGILARQYRERHCADPNVLILSPDHWAGECERHSPLLGLLEADTRFDYRRAVRIYCTGDAQLRVLLDPSLDDEDVRVARMDVEECLTS